MSNSVTEERERCALLCEELACMVDDGAGAVGRLWQAARNIRGGKRPGNFYPGRTEPTSPRDPDREVKALREALQDARGLLDHAGCPVGWIDKVLASSAGIDGVQEKRNG